MKARVHFNEFGQIISVVEVYDGDGDRPPAGVLLPRKLGTLETTIERDEPLIVVHTAHRVDLRGDLPKLVRIERSAGGTRQE